MSQITYRLGSRDGPVKPYLTEEFAKVALEVANRQWHQKNAWRVQHLQVFKYFGVPCLVAWYLRDGELVLLIGRAITGYQGEVIGQFP